MALHHVDGDCKSRGAVHLLSLRLRAGVLDHVSSSSHGTSTRGLHHAELLCDSSLCFLVYMWKAEPLESRSIREGESSDEEEGSARQCFWRFLFYIELHIYIKQDLIFV
ncbi:hypothetical protein Droror1_Dr00005982 [Drosera rotundifolia]